MPSPEVPGGAAGDMITMPAVQSFKANEELNVIRSSMGRPWDGVRVFESAIGARSEITLPPLEHHFIAMVLSGATDVEQRRDAKRYRSTARAGTVMIVPAGMSSYFNSSRDHRTSRTEIPVELLASAAEEIGMQGRPELQSVFETRDATIAHIVRLLLEELRRPAHPAQSLIAASASNALAVHLIRSFDTRTAALPKPPASLTRRQLATVLDHLARHIATPIELAEIATAANVSRFHFARLFKASTGMSPVAFLEASRIDRARALIRSGELRLADIALATGFADQSHFTRRFHRHTGVTPGQYRKNLQ